MIAFGLNQWGPIVVFGLNPWRFPDGVSLDQSAEIVRVVLEDHASTDVVMAMLSKAGVTVSHAHASAVTIIVQDMAEVGMDMASIAKVLID